jgi:DsbC/DsbD-like thiol-disulfide interchange protein
MKRIVALLMFLVIGSMAISQTTKDPVTWNYVAKKKADNTYDIILTATLPKPWHIYSMKTGKGGPIPTKILFKKHPLISLFGAIKENGKMESMYDENFETEVKYYANKVEFVQTIVLKGKVKTNITGSVEYMVCDDERCLPPTTKTFEIKLI